MVQDSYLVFLTSRRRSPDIPAEQLTEWRAYMSANHLRVGISDSFENPLLAGACLEQAKAAQITLTFAILQYLGQPAV